MAKFEKKKLKQINKNTMQYETRKGLARWHTESGFAVVTRVKGRHKCDSEEQFTTIIKEHLLTQ
jgi:hypothetical protein